MKSCRREFIAGLAILLTILPPQTATSAAGFVSLHWQDCATPIATNRNMGSGPIDRIVVTLSGASGVIRGIGIRLNLSAGYAVLPPAWHFDAEGCESGRLAVKQTAAAAGCPVLLGANSNTLSGFLFNEDIARGQTYYYAAFDPFMADPAKTYTLVQFEFDHSNAISGFGITPEACGCLDRPLCIQLSSSSYLDANNDELALPVGQGFLSWNDLNNSLFCGSGGPLCGSPGCEPIPLDSTCVVQVPTPANLRSWGSVKATYR